MLLALALLAGIEPALAQGAPDQVLFGPKQYVRTTEAPNEYTDRFSVPQAVGAPFLLRIVNGEANGSNRISSASVTVNGVQVAGPADFNETVALIERGVALSSTNTLEVRVASTPGAYLTVSVLGTRIPPVPTSLAPNPLLVTAGASGSLTATLAPAPLSAGTLAVTSANPGVASVPAAVAFSAGQTAVLIPVTGVGAGATTVTASVNGGSASATVNVNAPPTVSIASPATNSTFAAPANVTVTAIASDSDGTIARVDFFQGATLVGTATSAPYTVTLNALAAGAYSLTARATDNLGAQTTSAAVSILVDMPPTVSLTSPSNGQVLSAPANITLTANAADPDGTISKVDFYQGATLVGTATTAPYTVGLANAPSGSYTYTARATDNAGLTTTSAPVNVTVDTPPTVSISAPANNAVIVAPANVTITATAADADGTVTKVDFYANGALVGTANAAPFTFTLNNPASGNYVLTAVATDNVGLTTTSAPVNITVDAPPTVNLISPANNAVFIALATITLTATATDVDGTIAKVDFFQGATLVATVTSTPYSFTLNNVAVGAYSFTAVATDNLGASTTSSAIGVTVNPNRPPTVSITSPASNSTFVAPATINITASASDTDGTVAKVEFFEGANLLGTVTTASYTFNFNNVAAGNYTLFAKATDNLGATTTSAAINVTVNPNQPPSVTLTSPANNAIFTAPATITLTATASDTDGTVTQVEFLSGANVAATLTNPPYTFNLTNIGAGSYTLAARATDDKGAQTTSTAVTVTVTAASATIFYIYTDQLNTPRAITNEAATTIWTWDNNDPFGNNAPNEDPDGDNTKFTFNLRFPGQYFDKETNLHYNYFRDYDPSIGRYVESDPIGLEEGLNLYSYVLNNSISFTDPRGLDAPGLTVMLQKPPSTSACPPDDCPNPITITTNGVCRAGDPLCAQAMQAAGMQGPYFPTTTTYSGACLLKFGVGFTGGKFVAGTIVLNQAPNIAARAGLSMANVARVATAASVLNSPPAMVVGGSVAIAGILKQCECSSK